MWCGGGVEQSKILAFKHKAPRPTEAFQNTLRVLYSQNKSAPPQVKRTLRTISSTPERILVPYRTAATTTSPPPLAWPWLGLDLL
jgi:hypothetical protein